MTTVVVGAGAIGLLVAGRLAAAGEAVLIQARPRGAAQLNAEGITLRQPQGTHTTKAFHALGEPEELPEAARPVQLAIVCVKGYDTTGTFAALHTLNPAQIITLQNGIGNEELLVAEFGAARVVSGTITTSVEIDETTITVTKEGGIGVAPIAGQDVQPIAQLFEKAGFTVNIQSDYRAMKWSKALLNMLGNASGALLDMPVDAVYANTRLVGMERAVIREAVQVMQRLGIRPLNLPRYPAVLLARAMRYLPLPVLQPILRKMVGGGRGGKPPSLLLELQRKNPRSEGQFLYGAVAEAGATVGVPTPVNAALWRLLDGVATGTIAWETVRGKPDVLLEHVYSSR